MWIKFGSSLFQYFIKMLCISAPKKVIFRIEVSEYCPMRGFTILLSVSERHYSRVCILNSKGNYYRPSFMQ